MPLTIAPGVRWLAVEDGAVLFEPTGPSFMDVSDGGARIWSQLLETGFDIEAVSRWLVDGNGLTARDADRVVHELLDDLRRFGFVVEV